MLLCALSGVAGVGRGGRGAAPTGLSRDFKDGKPETTAVASLDSPPQAAASSVSATSSHRGPIATARRLWLANDKAVRDQLVIRGQLVGRVPPKVTKAILGGS